MRKNCLNYSTNSVFLGCLSLAVFVMTGCGHLGNVNNNMVGENLSSAVSNNDLGSDGDGYNTDDTKTLVASKPGGDIKLLDALTDTHSTSPKCSLCGNRDGIITINKSTKNGREHFFCNEKACQEKAQTWGEETRRISLSCQGISLSCQERQAESCQYCNALNDPSATQCRICQQSFLCFLDWAQLLNRPLDLPYTP